MPVAHAYNYFDLGASFATSTLNTAGNIVSDLSSFIYVVGGVLLGGLLITLIVGALHAKH